MQTRMGMGATALLYLGPLLAGLSGMGWAGVPVFVALFALWLVVMRPAQWPRDPGQWTAQTGMTAVTQLALNALIVAVLFGIGRGIGGVAGYVPQIGAAFPVALSFLAIPLSRLAGDPARAAPAPGASPQPPTPMAEGGDDMVAVLMGLPDDSDPMLVADAMDAAMKGPRANDRLDALAVALGKAHPGGMVLREAAVLWATDPSRHPAEGLRSAQEVAFGIAGDDPVLLNLFAHRGAALLARDGSLWSGFPLSSRVVAAADAAQTEASKAALSDLAASLDRAADAEGLV